MFDIAFSMLVPIFVGLITGYYLDKAFSPKFPVWTITLTIFGAITGMWSIYKRYGK